MAVRHIVWVPHESVGISWKTPSWQQIPEAVPPYGLRCYDSELLDAELDSSDSGWPRALAREAVDRAIACHTVELFQRHADGGGACFGAPSQQQMLASTHYETTRGNLTFSSGTLSIGRLSATLCKLDTMKEQRPVGQPEPKVPTESLPRSLDVISPGTPAEPGSGNSGALGDDISPAVGDHRGDAVQEIDAETMYNNALDRFEANHYADVEQLLRRALVVCPAHAQATTLLATTQRLEVPGFRRGFDDMDETPQSVSHSTEGSGKPLFVATVTVYLNERWVPVRGFSSGNLLPTERSMFSLADGTRNFGFGFDLGDLAIVLPSGWAW